MIVLWGSVGKNPGSRTYFDTCWELRRSRTSDETCFLRARKKRIKQSILISNRHATPTIVDVIRSHPRGREQSKWTLQDVSRWNDRMLLRIHAIQHFNTIFVLHIVNFSISNLAISKQMQLPLSNHIFSPKWKESSKYICKNLMEYVSIIPPSLEKNYGQSLVCYTFWLVDRWRYILFEWCANKGKRKKRPIRMSGSMIFPVCIKQDWKEDLFHCNIMETRNHLQRMAIFRHAIFGLSSSVAYTYTGQACIWYEDDNNLSLNKNASQAWNGLYEMGFDKTSPISVQKLNWSVLS